MIALRPGRKSHPRTYKCLVDETKHGARLAPVITPSLGHTALPRRAKRFHGGGPSTALLAATRELRRNSPFPAGAHEYLARVGSHQRRGDAACPASSAAPRGFHGASSCTWSVSGGTAIADGYTSCSHAHLRGGDFLWQENPCLSHPAPRVEQPSHTFARGSTGPPEGRLRCFQVKRR